MRIFIIGFNKTATRTLHYFFKGNGLNAIHWDDGNLVKVSYIMQDTSSIGIEMRIYVNGNESGGTLTYDDAIDFTCPTNTTGVVSFNSPLAVNVGDYIQIQYRNGAAGGSNDDPDDSSWTIYEEITT